MPKDHRKKEQLRNGSVAELVMQLNGKVEDELGLF